MTPTEIIKQCEEQIEISGEKADIMLVMPGKWGKTNKKKLCKIKGAPIGEIVCDDFGRGIHVFFNAIEVKNFIENFMEKEKK